MKEDNFCRDCKWYTKETYVMENATYNKELSLCGLPANNTKKPSYYETGKNTPDYTPLEMRASENRCGVNGVFWEKSRVR